MGNILSPNQKIARFALTDKEEENYSQEEFENYILIKIYVPKQIVDKSSDQEEIKSNSSQSQAALPIYNN